MKGCFEDIQKIFNNLYITFHYSSALHKNLIKQPENAVFLKNSQFALLTVQPVGGSILTGLDCLLVIASDRRVRGDPRGYGMCSSRHVVAGGIM